MFLLKIKKWVYSRFFVKAIPEGLFKYTSKSSAFWRSVKAMAVLTRQGLYFDVRGCCQPSLKLRRGSLRFPLRSKRRLVGARGFEPPTSCSQSRRASRLRHAPMLEGFYHALIARARLLIRLLNFFKKIVYAASDYLGNI